jgi:rhodanese-related sulfurtransferase
MRRPLVLLVVLAIGGAFVPKISDAQGANTQIDIAAMQPGVAPEGFTFWRTGSGEAAEWRVVTDPSAAGQKAIAQTSKDTTDYRFPLAVYQPVSAKNVDVVVRFKPVAGTVDQAGGIAVRLTTPDDYYVVRANALEDNVRFYRVVKGRREELKGSRIPSFLTPLAQLEQRLAELPADREIVAYCRGPWCVLSFEAVAMLRQRGYQARRLEDGFPEWKVAGLPIGSTTSA